MSRPRRQREQPQYHGLHCRHVLTAPQRTLPGRNTCLFNATRILLHENVAPESADCQDLHWALFRAVFPLLLVLSIVGNSLNLLVYRLKCFKGSAAVHLLRLKAIANVAFVLSLSLEMAHAFSRHGSAAHRPPVRSSSLEAAYWHAQPWCALLANFFGTASTWSTLLITIQTVICIALPLHFRQISTPRNIGAGIALILTLSVALSINFPIVRKTVERNISQNFDRWPSEPGAVCTEFYEYRSVIRPNSPLLASYERGYFWVHAVAAILIPCLAMLVCTAIVKHSFPIDGLGEGFTQRRKVVLKITFATTLAHLVLEGPGIITVFIAALHGSDIDSHAAAYCYLTLTTNYLAIVNATIPFFMYAAINKHFRFMSVAALRYVLPDCCFPPSISMSGSGINLQQTMQGESQARIMRLKIRRATLHFADVHKSLRKSSKRPALSCQPKPASSRSNISFHHSQSPASQSLVPHGNSYYSANDETELNEYEKYHTALFLSLALQRCNATIVPGSYRISKSRRQCEGAEDRRGGVVWDSGRARRRRTRTHSSPPSSPVPAPVPVPTATSSSLSSATAPLPDSPIPFPVARLLHSPLSLTSLPHNPPLSSTRASPSEPAFPRASTCVGNLGQYRGTSLKKATIDDI